MTYTTAGLVVLTVAALLVLVGVHDVWRHVWQTPPENMPTVHTGESPGNHPTRPAHSPR